MFGLLRFCSQCGQEVQPYRPIVMAEIGPGTGGSLSNVQGSYQCDHCDQAWPMPILGGTGQECVACGRFMPLGLNYCGHCGHAASAPASPDERSVSVDQVASILGLIAAPPNLRERPGPGDLAGRYQFWFDDGACAQNTGSNDYVFSDGTTAMHAVTAGWLWVTIKLPNGEIVDVQQRR